MNTKISRRVLLSAGIGGLVATPFVVRYLSKKTGATLEGYSGYTHFSVRNVDSDMPPSELKKAIDLLFVDRDKWLTFQGVEASARITLESTSSTSTLVTDPYHLASDEVSFSMKREKNTDIQLGEFSTNFHLLCKETKSEKKIIDTMLTPRALGKIEGVIWKKKQHFLISDYEACLGLLAMPFYFWLDFNDTYLGAHLEHLWKVKQITNNSCGPLSYSFISNEKSVENVSSSAELSYCNGCMATLDRPQDTEKPYTKFIFASPAHGKKNYFPTQVDFIFKAPSGSFEIPEGKISVSISDINFI